MIQVEVEGNKQEVVVDSKVEVEEDLATNFSKPQPAIVDLSKDQPLLSTMIQLSYHSNS